MAIQSSINQALGIAAIAGKLGKETELAKANLIEQGGEISSQIASEEAKLAQSKQNVSAAKKEYKIKQEELESATAGFQGSGEEYEAEIGPLETARNIAKKSLDDAIRARKTQKQEFAVRMAGLSARAERYNVAAKKAGVSQIQVNKGGKK